MSGTDVRSLAITVALLFFRCNGFDGCAGERRIMRLQNEDIIHVLIIVIAICLEPPSSTSYSFCSKDSGVRKDINTNLLTDPRAKLRQCFHKHHVEREKEYRSTRFDNQKNLSDEREEEAPPVYAIYRSTRRPKEPDKKDEQWKTVYRSRQRQPKEPDKKKDKKPFHQFVFFWRGQRGGGSNIQALPPARQKKRSSIVEEDSPRVVPEVVEQKKRILFVVEERGPTKTTGGGDPILSKANLIVFGRENPVSVLEWNVRQSLVYL
jgi:hypothetical protein